MYVFWLSTGKQVQVDLEIEQLDVEHSLKSGSWFTDENGWTINPAHVVAFRDYGE